MATVHFTDAELTTMLFALARQEFRLMEAHSLANGLALLARGMNADSVVSAEADAQRLKAEIDVCRSAKEKTTLALRRVPSCAARV